MTPEDGKFRVAFVLQHSNSESDRIDTIGGACFHELKERQAANKPDSLSIITLESESKWPLYDYTKKITEPGYYHLYFSNCERTTRSDFSLTVTQYNVEPLPDGRLAINYLSAGESSLPIWYFFITIAFGCELFAFVSYSLKHRSVPSLHGYHFVWTHVLCDAECT